VRSSIDGAKFCDKTEGLSYKLFGYKQQSSTKMGVQPIPSPNEDFEHVRRE
jgi:hypothetical protein